MIEDIELAAKVHYSFLPEDYEDEHIIVAKSLRTLYTIGGDYCSILPLYTGCSFAAAMPSAMEFLQLCLLLESIPLF